MKDLTVGNEYKVILKFSVPILIGNLFQQLYNIIDSIIVGNFLGKNDLAAVGFSFNIILLLLALSMGITMGTSVIISQYYGAKDMDNIKKAIDTSYVFSFILSIMVTVIGICFSEPILIFFKVPLEVLPLAKIFINTILIGTICSFGYNTITNVLRGLGDSKTSVYFLIISAVLNIILDIVFIILLKRGIQGAALGTIISQAFAFIGTYIYMSRIYPQFRFNLKHIKFDMKILKLSLKIGIPSVMQQLFVSIGFLTIQVLINGFGASAMAAYTVASKIDSFAEIPTINLGKALSNFVAQNIGANLHDRVNKGYRGSLIMGTVISIIITIIIMAFPKYLICLFTNDEAVIKIGINYLRIIGSFYIVFSAMQIINGALIGAGCSFIPMTATIVSLCLMQVPVAIVLSHQIGINGVWIAAPIGWTGGLAIRFLYYSFGHWRSKSIINQV
ncbi:MATE family efflux transporter [Clostridium sp. PL3]|uniref:Probable multidrug resistance protein NorM n=1 Tax=Clostridium thailandense TaxID=2794346 RepID=A0A949TMN8_9CLOT|nr:MATE family efflux transporter [Clostridium thailandense]MBV7272097.1 MATE family efflux transporter [Clostridium thailandense]